MRDYLKEYGITPYINAHDTITLYGASRMAQNTKEAMEQISRCFVDMVQLQCVLGQRIAKMTHNEAAYIANCASGAMQLCAAVCMAKGSEAAYRQLPNTSGMADEIVVLHAQHNCYDKALETAGAKLRIVGDADEALMCDLETAINQNTAAVLYCPNINYERASLPLETVVEAAHLKGVTVIVDAAACLPPVENLWRFTQAGADMVIFSGGKTLCGPQTSGLIVGKKQYIDDGIRFGAPQHGVCRSAKASRESMLGLCVAVENYIQLDHAKHKEQMQNTVDRLAAAMEGTGLYTPFIVSHGSVGQSYPRVFAHIASPHTAQGVVAKMREKGIFIGTDKQPDCIYLSPLNLTESECEAVCRALRETAAELQDIN